MLAKYLVPNLTFLTKNEFMVNSSFDFAEEIVGFNPKGLASFDVTSLFTNIPLNETIDIIISEIFDNPLNSKFIETFEFDIETKFFKCYLPGNENETYYFKRDQMRKLLELATLDNYFFFNENIYRQTDGVAMGSPLGPHLANIFMCYMERKWLQECPIEFKPILYRRYVDDTFLLFKCNSHIDLFLNYVNSQHPNIKFTCDKEKDSTLPFLDINIQKGDNEFTTSIYRKPTFTGLFSKYYAFSSKQNKENLVYTLTVRAFNICSNYFKLDAELIFLKDVLQKNGYPLNFIEYSIGKMLKKLYCSDIDKKMNFDVPKAKVYFSTFYLGEISKQLSNDIKKIVSQSYPQVNLLIIFKTHSTIGGQFTFKDKQPLLNRSNLIYRYTCQCCKAFYIGKTERQLGVRIAEHTGVSARTGKPFSNRPKSDIFDHCQKCHTDVLSENFTIEDSHKGKYGLEILESLHQKVKKPAIGIQQQSTPLLSFD